MKIIDAVRTVEKKYPKGTVVSGVPYNGKFYFDIRDKQTGDMLILGGTVSVDENSGKIEIINPVYDENFDSEDFSNYAKTHTIRFVKR